MNIELKNIQIFDRMSEETTAFCASLYIDGKKVGEAKNDGRGGSTTYHPDHLNYFPLIRKAEQYCKGLPPMEIDGGKEMGKYTVPMDLENFIDQLVTKFAEEKDFARFKKKMEKHQLTALLIGTETEYSLVYWIIPGSKKKRPIADILAHEKGVESIRTVIKKKKESMPAGHRILNTNIPKELL